MVTREELVGQWNEVKGRLKEHWGQLTDDDLRRAQGSTDQLVGVVQQKTGATRREIESFLSNIVHDQSTVERVSAAASQYAEEAGQIAKEQYARAAAATSDFSKQVSHTVRNRPTESLAIAFGVGLAAGALFFLGRRR